MHSYLKKLIIFLIAFCGAEINTYAQTHPPVLVLKKADLIKHKVQEISDSLPRTTSTPEMLTLYIFEKGLLQTAAYYEDEIYTSIDAAILAGYHYYYKPNGELIEWGGHGPTGIGTQNDFCRNFYVHGKLILKVNGISFSHMNESGEQLMSFIQYYYNKAGTVEKYVTYNIIEPDHKIVSNKEWQVFALSTDDVKNKQFLKRIRADKGSTSYFMYQDNKVVGIFPPEESTQKINALYQSDKLKELDHIGMKQFEQKYLALSKEYTKVLDDNYTPVKNNIITINKQPLKVFLNKINHGNAKYIAIEISDNTYIFYHIL